MVPTSVPQTCPDLWGTTHPEALEPGLVDGAMKCDRQDPKPQKEKGETNGQLLPELFCYQMEMKACLACFFFSETCVIAAWRDGFPHLQ